MNRLGCYDFWGTKNPLLALGASHPQALYVSGYLGDLKARTIVEEPFYFDRDYLSEFSAFYSTSSQDHSNRCRRLHVFACDVTRANLRSLAAGRLTAHQKLQAGYLGFIVLRPIESAPFGRTVLKWYREHDHSTPRVTSPSRPYVCHLLGSTLTIKGLAWQQQDSAVGACATIALWSMLHSSALGDDHAIPTTAEITRSANRTASLGARVFPSEGLTIYQVCEAIKEGGMAPAVVSGDVLADDGTCAGFSRERFSSVCATLIRSGYPVLITGDLLDLGDRHAICATGFRECAAQTPAAADQVVLQDSFIDYLYIHDDNLGPNVRFQVKTDSDDDLDCAVIETSPPSGKTNSPTTTYSAFRPMQIVAAMHEGIRTSPDLLIAYGLELSTRLKEGYNHLVDTGKITSGKMGLTMTARFMKLHEYVGNELGRVLKNSPDALGRLRLQIVEDVDPMSLHVGVVRIGRGSKRLADILFDTTDSDRNLRLYAFCAVSFDPLFGTHLGASVNTIPIRLGRVLAAY